MVTQKVRKVKTVTVRPIHVTRNGEVILVKAIKTTVANSRMEPVRRVLGNNSSSLRDPVQVALLVTVHRESGEMILNLVEGEPVTRLPNLQEIPSLRRAIA
ncbi:hypothetical protein [Halosimplex pelagicum]|uniref:hypothetical protein n=1 Tax=Halosimplex pelagicum TaxID=869886 RepID=UPI001FE71806|nr:hypothetical protein [Halosimplex pelagicum]